MIVANAIRREMDCERKALRTAGTVGTLGGLLGVFAVFTTHGIPVLAWTSILAEFAVPLTAVGLALGLRQSLRKRIAVAMDAALELEPPKAVALLAEYLSLKTKKGKRESPPPGLHVALARALTRMRAWDGDPLDTPAHWALTTFVSRKRRLRERDEELAKLSVAVCEGLADSGSLSYCYDELNEVAAMKARNSKQEKLRSAAARCLAAIEKRRAAAEGPPDEQAAP